MKMINLKTLFAVLVLCLLVSACGKDKKDAAAPAVSNPIYGGTTNNTGVVSAVSFEDFKAKVAAGQFGALPSTNVDYKYGTCSSSSSKFLGFIPVTSTSCGQSFTRTVYSGMIIREDNFSSRDQVITHLNSILNSVVVNSSTVRQLSGTAFQFISGNYIYVVNLAYPAEANPTYRASLTDGSYYYLYQYISF